MALARRATRRRMIQRRRCFRAADSSSLSAPTTSATSYSPTYFSRPSPPRPRHASSSPPLRCMIRHPAAATWARRRRWARSKASARGRDSIWSTAGRTTRTRRAPRLPSNVTVVLIHYTSTTYLRSQAYKDSKLCNMLFTAEASRRWAKPGVSVNAFSPGLIADPDGFFRYQARMSDRSIPREKTRFL